MSHTSPDRRLLILNNMPSFYRSKPFAALMDEWDARGGNGSHVLYQVRRDPHRRQDWFYSRTDGLPEPCSFASEETIKVLGRVTYKPRPALNTFQRFRPTHLLVPGWDSPTVAAAAVYTRLTGATMVSWVESNQSTSHHPGGAGDLWRRAIIGASRGFLVPSRASAEHVRSIRRSDLPFLQMPNPVDLDRLEDGTGTGTGAGGPRLLFVGDLSRRKGFDIFINAVARGRASGWRGLAYGADVEGLAVDAPSNCEVLGSRTLDTIISEIDPATDIWAIPSRADPAPLVYSEALALGVRVVVSDAVAYVDGVERQGVAYFRSEDPAGLISAANLVGAKPRPSVQLSRSLGSQQWAIEVANFFEKLDSVAAGRR